MLSTGLHFASESTGGGLHPRTRRLRTCSGDEHMTSFIYKNCTVGEVTGMSDLSFGFNILNERGQPILSLSFRTRDDAAQAFPASREASVGASVAARDQT